MNKTIIEWCDYTWNPVSGCFHPCRKTYCYNTVKWNSRLNRFGAAYFDKNGIKVNDKNWKSRQTGKCHIAQKGEVYPFGYDPTFYPHRLNQPAKEKKPQKIFTVDIGDLFGKWVPADWITAVIDVAAQCSQHTFMFLTKNPERYLEFKFPQNCWCGATVTSDADVNTAKILSKVKARVRFLSIEPLMGEISFPLNKFEWVILGAMTGTNPVVPDQKWMTDIVDQCKTANVPLFIKDNMSEYYGKKVRQFPK